MMFHAIDDLLSTYQTVKHVAEIHDEEKKLVKYITTVTLTENNASTVHTVIEEVMLTILNIYIRQGSRRNINMLFESYGAMKGRPVLTA